MLSQAYLVACLAGSAIASPLPMPQGLTGTLTNITGTLNSTTGALTNATGTLTNVTTTATNTSSGLTGIIGGLTGGLTNLTTGVTTGLANVTGTVLGNTTSALTTAVNQAAAAAANVTVPGTPLANGTTALANGTVVGNGGQVNITGLPTGAVVINSTTTALSLFNNVTNTTFAQSQSCCANPLLGNTVTVTAGNQTTVTTLYPVASAKRSWLRWLRRAARVSPPVKCDCDD
ncbi:hypothetical protein BT63DRAFT_110305 [Microthyrium microscopicum]|uniref:Uncharacterized protein n=1 Tax=Microthyrium microscopicum TaxID=703497 RepID=A0A6A6TXY2_9PEZI|nr:hypothetical protein BT63DRAFT_110305 [Microthyrium microscopicum]